MWYSVYSAEVIDLYACHIYKVTKVFIIAITPKINSMTSVNDSTDGNNLLKSAIKDDTDIYLNNDNRHAKSS